MFESVTFLQGLTVSFEAIGKLFLVILLGVVLVRRRILSPDVVNGMTRTMIDVIVPCALGISMIKGFHLDRMELVSPMLIFLPLMIVASTVICLVFFRLTAGGPPSARDRAATALASVPNSFYIPFPVALAVTPPEHHVMVGVLLGAAVLAINPIQWTLGSCIVMGDRRGRVSLRKTNAVLLTAPVYGG
ncbi:MAG: AEC family transporter, partial [Candidatus Sumerlaeia bacterium]|nr:AEC family transporter [Candidatus Sumerlaeia bacterium]